MDIMVLCLILIFIRTWIQILSSRLLVVSSKLEVELGILKFNDSN